MDEWNNGGEKDSKASGESNTDPSTQEEHPEAEEQLVQRQNIQNPRTREETEPPQSTVKCSPRSPTLEWEVLKKLEDHPECKHYAKKWMNENNVNPDELLEFLQLVPGGDKSSWPRLRGVAKQLNPPRVTFSVVVTGQTFGAHDTILERLKDKHLKVKARNHQCTVVFIPITSRAGSDVAAAMMRPEVAACDTPLILVLMHHTRDVDYPTAQRRCSQKFPRVKSEVHFVFHETQPGLLQCPLNSQAVQELEQAISSCGSS